MNRLIGAFAAALVAGCATSGSTTGDLTVLSAGAVESGLHTALDLFEKQSGKKVAAIYNTAPQVRERLQKGERYDVVIVPPGAMDALQKEGRVEGGRVMLGSVGQGLAVRPGAPVPDVSSVDALRKALREADSVVFNRATGGQYIESMLKKIGVYADIERKTVRYASAAEVMDHLLKGRGREIGFAPITEIMPYTKKGLRYVGPLPAEVQQRNAYVAAAAKDRGDAAADLLRFLATPAARSALAASGVE
jgi:molybdate transport system substrate-binding protein